MLIPVRQRYRPLGGGATGRPAAAAGPEGRPQRAPEAEARHFGPHQGRRHEPVASLADEPHLEDEHEPHSEDEPHLDIPSVTAPSSSTRHLVSDKVSY